MYIDRYLEIYLKEKAITPSDEPKYQNVPLSEKVQRSNLVSTQSQETATHQA
jgi:hypothetical protein